MLFVIAMLFGVVVTCWALEGWRWLRQTPRFDGEATPLKPWILFTSLPRLLALLIVLSAAFVFLLQAAALQDTPPAQFRRELGSTLLHVATGIGLGALLYWVLKTIRQSRSDYVGALLLSLGALTLFTVLVLTEDQYEWFGRIQRASIGGNSVELSPRGQVPLVTAPTAFRSDPGSVSGADRVGRALEFLEALNTAIEHDRDNMRRSGEIEDALGKDLELDLQFARNVVLPVVTLLRNVHKEAPNDNVFVTIPEEFIVGIRQFSLDSYRLYVAAQTENGQFRDLPVSANSQKTAEYANFRQQYASLWQRFRETLQRNLLQSLCERPAVHAAGHETAKQCRTAMTGANAQVEAIDRAINAQAYGGQVFGGRLPYGMITVLWVLHAAGYSGAAEHGIGAWLENARNQLAQPTTNRHLLVPYWRAAFNHSTRFLESNVQDRQLGVAVERLTRLLDASGAILAMSGWQSIQDAHLDQNAQRRADAYSHCRTVFAAQHPGPRLLFFHYQTMNNLAYYRARRMLFHGSHSTDSDLEATLALLQRVRWPCFFQPDQTEGLLLSQVFYHNTIAVARVAISRQAATPASSLQQLCAARAAAQEQLAAARLLRTREADAEADRAHERILIERADAERSLAGVNADLRARLGDGRC